MKKMVFFGFLMFAMPLWAGSANDQKIDNLRAFTKLYGYVRFFHPSDAAAAIDWDKFAILGAERVANASDTAALKMVLDSLFMPIAPTLQIYRIGEAPQPYQPYKPTGGLDSVIVWQHRGVELKPGGVFESVRLFRSKPPAGMIAQEAFIPENIQPREIRIEARMQAEVVGSENFGQLWLKVYKTDGSLGFFDRLHKPVTTKEWKNVRVSTGIGPGASRIEVGGYLSGVGRVWIDKVSASVMTPNNSWTQIPLLNPGLNDADSLGRPKNWQINDPRFHYRIAPDSMAENATCLLIESGPDVASRQLFEQHPTAGDVMDKELAAGLRAQIPLAIYPADAAKQGSPQAGFAEVIAAIDLKKRSATESATRFGAVVIAWNVFQHFYPNFENSPATWDSALTGALTKAAADTGSTDFYDTLTRLVALTGDSQSRIAHPFQKNWAYLPFQVDWIENQVVITASADSAHFLPGDVITAFNGAPASRHLADLEARVAGSPQWERMRALGQFGQGDKSKAVQLTLERNGKAKKVRSAYNQTEPLNGAFRRATLEKVDNDIYYIDLTRVSASRIERRLAEIAEMKGLIFDLRGPLLENMEILRHLLDGPVESPVWQIPQILYPDRERPAGDHERTWQLMPKAPRFKGKAVFIVDGRTAGEAEALLSLVEQYKLGEIIGQLTAGALGNINLLDLPGGYRVMWTGMRVVVPNYPDFHHSGIVPGQLLTRTSKGVREGRDALIERAVEMLKAN